MHKQIVGYGQGMKQNDFAEDLLGISKSLMAFNFVPMDRIHASWVPYKSILCVFKVVIMARRRSSIMPFVFNRFMVHVFVDCFIKVVNRSTCRPRAKLIFFFNSKHKWQGILFKFCHLINISQEKEKGKHKPWPKAIRVKASTNLDQKP